MAEVAPDLTLAGFRIVRLADARKQEKLHVEKLERAENDEIRRLLPLRARRIHVSDAGRPFARAIEVNARHLALCARFEIRIAQQHRQDCGLRSGLGIVRAAKPFAKAAKCALAELDAERIGIGLREGSGRLWKRLVTH